MRSVKRVKRKLADGTVKVYEYDRAAMRKRDGPSSGTLGELIALYLASPDFTRLAESTRKTYQLGLRPWLDHKQVRHIDARAVRRAHVLEFRDALSERPGMADLFVRATQAVFRFGMDRERVDVNPAAKIPRLANGEHRRWTDDEVGRLLLMGRPLFQMAGAMALFTGQRQGDILAMRWKDMRNGRIIVRQQKTTTALVIPIHPLLSAALDRWPKKTDTILYTQYGEPFTTDGFRSSWFLEKNRLGITATWHGLRKTAAAALAEAGATVHEIAAITGHKSLREIERYTKEADQLRRAEAAVAKFPQWRMLDVDPVAS